MLFFLKKCFGNLCKIENEGKIVLLFLVVYLTLRCVAKSLWSCFCKVFAPLRSCLFTLIQTAFLLQYMRHRAFLRYNFLIISEASRGCSLFSEIDLKCKLNRKNQNVLEVAWLRQIYFRGYVSFWNASHSQPCGPLCSTRPSNFGHLEFQIAFKM